MEAATRAMPPAIRAVALRKTYGAGDNAVHALAGVDVDIHAGSFVAVMGPSGSGKSTLMHCLAGLDTASSGTVEVDGTNLGQLSDRALTGFRGERVGFVFQAFNLLASLTAAQNIDLPALLTGRPLDPQWRDELVERLNLADRLDHLPSQLSGGQQQRVAVARALVTRPAVVFADEPTGNLDTTAALSLLRFFQHSVHVDSQTIVMVTHDPVAAAHTDRVVLLRDGIIVGEVDDPTVETVLDAMKQLET